MMNLEEKIQNLTPSQRKLYDKLSAMTDEELIEYHRQVKDANKRLRNTNQLLKGLIEK